MRKYTTFEKIMHIIGSIATGAYGLIVALMITGVM